MGRLAALVAPRGGAILAIDYGYERTQTGETLQAVSRHAFADPLTNRARPISPPMSISKRWATLRAWLG